MPRRALKDTDHYLALGNIESARGRIVRRSGEYAKALEHFDRAIAIYSAGNPESPQSRQNAGECRLCEATSCLAAAKENRCASAQAESQHGRQPAAADVEPTSSSARPISATLPRGNPAVTASTGDLYAPWPLRRAGGSDCQLRVSPSGSEAISTAPPGRRLEAYRIGHEKNDQILMARARVLQTATENAKIEEQLGEDVDTALHANQAKQFSEEALALAQHTQNRRLLAAAYIARGMTAANEFFQEWDLAKRCASEATDLIGAGENDHLAGRPGCAESRTSCRHPASTTHFADGLRGWWAAKPFSRSPRNSLRS